MKIKANAESFKTTFKNYFTYFKRATKKMDSYHSYKLFILSIWIKLKINRVPSSQTWPQSFAFTLQFKKKALLVARLCDVVLEFDEILRNETCRYQFSYGGHTSTFGNKVLWKQCNAVPRYSFTIFAEIGKPFPISARFTPQHLY